jgi:hypothetical protein
VREACLTEIDAPRTRNLPQLFAFIEGQTERRFNWRGQRDCVAFMAGCVKAQTGIDPRGDYRWRNRREAHAIIVAEGNLMMAIDARFDRVVPSMAARGDIAAVPDDVFGIRLMIVEGDMLVGPGEHGLERQPRSAMRVAWDAMSVRLLESLI